MEQHNGHKCQVTGLPGDANNMVPIKALSRRVRDRISKEGHVCDHNGFIMAEVVNRLIQPSAEEDETSNLSADELEETYEKSLTIGERIADRIADFGGSWSFISLFLIFIAVWITINIISTLNLSFDEYPFILLNLILSCVAALQAPIIMMSQNRQEAKDRLRARNDYYINLKAEKEIRELNKKVEELIKITKKQ
jgi:uncharacterized membrane protein